jgi:MFS family permease
MRALAPVAALLWGVAFLLMGNGLQGTLLPVRATLEDFSPLAIGILGAAYFAGFILGCLAIPWIIRRVGHIRAFTALTALASTIALVHALFPEPVVWWGLRGVTGFCFAGLYTVIESWINERASNENRGSVLAFYTIINLTVIIAGQQMLALYHPSGFEAFVLASVLVSLAAIPVAMSVQSAPAPVTEVRIRPGYLFRLSPVAFTGCVAVGLSNGAFWSLGPAFGIQIGLSPSDVALFMSTVVLGGALGQWPFGKLSDRLDRRWVLAGASALAASAGIGFFLLGARYPAAFYGCAGLFGLAAFPIYAICVAHANDHVSNRNFVEISGSLLLAHSFGAIFGPVIAALVMQAVAPAALFAWTATIHVALALFCLYRITRRARPGAATRDAFVAVPRTAPALFEFDPRAPTDEAAAAPVPPEAALGEPD